CMKLIFGRFTPELVMEWIYDVYEGFIFLGVFLLVLLLVGVIAMIDSIFAWLGSYEFSFWHLPLWFFASVIYYFLWDLVIDHYKPYP
ncbi:hypothetical protein P3675_25660, partial [Vibrio parahaemolyticus]|nr:hypothetical protein [Vibrio parahaemolyticus]